MRNPLATLLFAVFIITGVLLLELGSPVPGFGETFRAGTVNANVNVREKPSLRSHIVYGLLQGAPVKIYAEKDGWYRVSAKKYHQVFSGWISIQYVEAAAVETTATPSGSEAPEPDPRAPSRPSAEKPVQSAPSAQPEKPLPTPAVKSPPPETKAPVVSPAPEPVKRTAKESPPVAKAAVVSPTPEPDKQAAATPPKKKMAATQTKRPLPVKKRPVPAADPEPADDLMGLLPIALPVLVVIVLLIGVIVYRVRRASGPKAEKPALPAAPPVWPPPPPEDSPALAESEPIEENEPTEESESIEESVAIEESEPAEEDLPSDFEFQMESMDAYGTSGDNGDSAIEVVPVSDDVDSATAVVSVSDDVDSVTAVVSVSDDDDSAIEVVPVSDDDDSAIEVVPVSDDVDSAKEVVSARDEDDSPTQAVPVYDQVMEKIKRMSDGELAELLDLVDKQLGEEPRKDNRLLFYTTVDYVVEDQYYRDFLQDLSVSGVFIKSRQMFETGQHIRMSFMSPFLQQPFKISGEIVRTTDTGIGVNFDKESQVQTEAISALMEQIRMIEETG